MNKAEKQGELLIEDFQNETDKIIIGVIKRESKSINERKRRTHNTVHI